MTTGPTGLVVHWSTSPELPSTVVDGISIERARFALGSLRVVGDAGPGDPRTTASAVEMCFAWSDVCSSSEDITFEDAPPGLYSQVAINLDGIFTLTKAYEIRGHVVVAGDEWEYRIEDALPLPFNVGIDEMVSPGETATIDLRINFMHALEAIDWANVELDGDKLELETGDSQMTSFRTKLVESFQIGAANR